MKKKALAYTLLIAYTTLAAFGIMYFSLSMFVAIGLLVLVPLVVLITQESLHRKMVAWLAVGSFSLSLLISVFAYVNGVWFETSPTELRLFGLVPFEALLASFLHILFYIVAYEYFFDDRIVSAVIKHKSTYKVIITALLALSVGYVFLFSFFLLTYAFAWLIALLSFLFFFAVLLVHHDRVRLLKRVGVFTLAMLPLSLLYEYVALESNFRFFANVNEYLHTFTVFGQLIPLEELLLVLLVPGMLALFYELFFDDEL